MTEYKLKSLNAFPDKKINFLLPIAFLWSLVIIAVLVISWYDADAPYSRDNYYLLPWCFVTGAVILAPSAYLLYKKQFNLFHPLVFAAWSYFFPAFVLGGIILSLGLSQPYFLAFVQDERYNLPLTLCYVMIGYASLSAGFFLPFGRKIGEIIGRRLPVWNWQSERVLMPGIVLLVIGLINTLVGFTSGLLGYQTSAEIGVYDGLLFLLTLFWLEASFLLWMCIFRARRLNVIHYLIMGALLATALTKSAFQGNRGSLIQIFILIAFAFVASGRKIKLKEKVIAGVLISFALIVGMIYGTTFRNIKQTQERMEIGQYAGIILETFDKIAEEDWVETLGNGFASLAERIESVSSLAVVVSNYEKLMPYEESYGIDNGIWKESITFFIPRVVWNDKPIATDPKKYADLYFNYSENSFTLTPMGDLLRNFGAIGVPLGMLFLGFVLRIIYAGLIENQNFSFWRATLFYMLVSAVSYEGSYGLIIPALFKFGFIAFVGILIVRFLAGKTRETS